MPKESTMIQAPESKKAESIAVRPYFDPTKNNMGLEKYGMTVYEGVAHFEQLALIEVNGIKRYITGLNEFAPEVKLLKDETMRTSKIKEIRKVVSQLEKDLASNIVEPNDKDFWNKVQLLKPNNEEFWNKISIRCGNEPLYLDPLKDPYDLIKIYAIEAGGFSMIAPSYEVAKNASVAYKFYLDRSLDTLSTRTEITKLRNKAISELESLYASNMTKLMYVAKVLDGNSVQYKKSTPNDLIYQNMDNYIHAQGVEASPKRAIQGFLDISSLDMETLKLRALIKDATFYKIIAFKTDGFIYHVDTSTMMGRNVSDCLEFLKNPLNDSTLKLLMDKVESYWNH